MASAKAWKKRGREVRGEKRKLLCHMHNGASKGFRDCIGTHKAYMGTAGKEEEEGGGGREGGGGKKGKGIDREMEARGVWCNAPRQGHHDTPQPKINERRAKA